MKKSLTPICLTLLLFTSMNLFADDNGDDESSPFEFALIGDVPYAPTAVVAAGKVQVYPSPEYNALIADINNHNKVAFTSHVGDIKAGDTRCDDNVYTNNLALFNSFRNAMIYNVGDNEWTDCHRANNGAYNPVERLAFLRTMFFTSNKSFGQRPITLTRQTGFPENTMWQTGAVLFVGLNQPGSNNNHLRVGGLFNSETEYTARNSSNILWVKQAFSKAIANPNIKGIMFMQQANVFERFLETGQGYVRSGYEDFVKELRTQTVAYGKPVVLVGGDTHTVRIDKPLTDLYPAHSAATGPAVVLPTVGTRIANFTRVEVYGSPDVHWIRVSVDSKDPNLFSFSLQAIPGNGHGRDGRQEGDDEDFQ